MSRRGFTLIEITVALLVGGMALTAAAALLTGLGHRAEAIRAAGARVDRAANFERLLRALWANLRASSDSTRTVAGDSTAVRFHTWCETVEGWLRPCRADLTVKRDGIRLELQSPQGRTVALFGSSHGEARIRYLRDAANGGSWLSRWTDVVAPPAIAILMGADTLVLSTW